MKKCLQLSYDVSGYIPQSFFSTEKPIPGQIYLFEVDAKDSDGKKYKIQVQQNGIIPKDKTIVKQYSNYAVYSVENPDKLIADISFSIPTYVSNGFFVVGKYESVDGSKLVVNETNIRKLCIRL